MRVEPYLYFNGRCEEAMTFYRRTIGAEITALQRFKDVPGAQAPAGAEEKVLHGALKIGDSTVFASDGDGAGAPDFKGFALALAATNDNEAERLFATLADGGRVQVPLISTPFASRFGIVADRFGVVWSLVVYKQAA